MKKKRTANQRCGVIQASPQPHIFYTERTKKSKKKFITIIICATYFIFVILRKTLKCNLYDIFEHSFILSYYFFFNIILCFCIK